MIDFNFWPFHKHEYEIIRWRLVHQPNWEPARRVVRFKCSTCGKEKNHFPKVERNESWEKENRHLQGFWNGDELYLDPTINEKTEELE